MDQNSPLAGQQLSDEEALADLGSRLARVRLDRNLTQATLAAEAGVSTSTVKRLEAGGSTQLTNLMRVLRALGLLANLAALVPVPAVRPLEVLERHGGRRQRASPAPEPNASESEAAAAPWTWGDER
jgi:transcriptional regulator with XRE-family HTH domain